MKLINEDFAIILLAKIINHGLMIKKNKKKKHFFLCYHRNDNFALQFVAVAIDKPKKKNHRLVSALISAGRFFIFSEITLKMKTNLELVTDIWLM